jgi:alanyl-tRNA synthetase
MNWTEIGERFVHHYLDLGFQLLPSSSLLHPSIPMSFVMSAGLVQVEAGIALSAQAEGSSYVMQQRCFRHFDLDCIGKSDLHLSLFEMPGAFTFEQNGKEKTIRQMWGLITNVLYITPDRLWVTYFAGGVKGNHEFPPDEEAHRVWRDIGLAEDRIVALGAETNLWMQGGGIDGGAPYRKCGPNTEVFFDRGEVFRCGDGCKPGCPCGRFVEFANTLFVFAEVDQGTGALRHMGRPFNETVVGTERVGMITQGRSSVYDIDSVRPLIDKVHAFSNSRYSDSVSEASERVICDHTRALVFLVADGAPPPGKGGRQRIIKQLVRGVLAHQRLLGIAASSFLPELIDVVLDVNDGGGSNLFAARNTLLDYFASERLRFDATLDRGFRELEHLLSSASPPPCETQLRDFSKKYGVPLPLMYMRLDQLEVRPWISPADGVRD